MKIWRFVGVWTLSAVFALSCAGRQPAGETGEIEIVMGSLSSGVIVTEKGERYGLAADEMGRELLNRDGKQVIVTGHVVEKGGRKVISVTSYQVVEKNVGDKEKADD